MKTDTLDTSSSPPVQAPMRSEEQVSSLVREHERLVHYQVNRYLRRYAVHDMERDDLVAWGLLGLLNAARAWDPKRGAFSTVACQAVDWMLQRGARRHERGRKAGTLSLDDLLSTENTGAAQDRAPDWLVGEAHVESGVVEAETHAAIRRAVAALPALERRLIERHFYEDVPIARLADEWGVSRQHLTERRRKAFRQLRAALSSSSAGASA